MWKLWGKRCLYQSPSGIRVYQNLFFRWITFDSKPIQTLISRSRPEQVCLSYLRPFCFGLRLKAGSVCLLGLGGGAALHHLAACYPGIVMVAVENNSEMITIAKQYFYLDNIKNLTILQQNAEEFVQHNETHYTHFLIDLFDKDAFPLSCNHFDFFQRCYQCLKPGGMLTINVANPQQITGIHSFLRSIFAENTLILSLPDCPNVIILAFKGQKAKFLALLKASSLKNLYWDPHWGLHG